MPNDVENGFEELAISNEMAFRRVKTDVGRDRGRRRSTVRYVFRLSQNKNRSFFSHEKSRNGQNTKKPYSSFLETKRLGTESERGRMDRKKTLRLRALFSLGRFFFRLVNLTVNIVIGMSRTRDQHSSSTS